MTDFTVNDNRPGPHHHHHDRRSGSILDWAIIGPAIGHSFAKLNPRTLIRNPVMFVVETVAALTAWLRTQSPGHEAALSGGKVLRCAVNQDFAGPEAPVRPGDEVAFFPPVTGG